jgi:hypothetical protein
MMRASDVDERSMRHAFTIYIATNNSGLVIAGPKDVRGFKNAIWGELAVARGDNLTLEILAHGWKYKTQPAAGAKKG